MGRNDWDTNRLHREELMRSTGQLIRDTVKRLRLPIIMLIAMWVVYFFQLITANAVGYALAIYPRDFSHWWAIIFAPFVHWSFAHILNNSILFIILGSIVAFEGNKRFAVVTLITMVTSGCGAWLLAMPGSATGGMSGVIFGYAAYIIAMAFAEQNLKRKLIRIIVAVVVVSWWGMTFLSGFIPQTTVSWQGHLFGALGGILVAWLIRRRADN